MKHIMLFTVISLPLLLSCRAEGTRAPSEEEPLLSLLPKRIAGTDLTTRSLPSGDQVLNAGSEEWRNYLATLGKTNADVSRAAAFAPAGAALEFKMSAFRIAGLDWTSRLETFQANVSAASGGVTRFEQVTLGGKNARRAVHTEKPSVAPIYYYAASDILFSIQSPYEAAVAEALAALPARTGATPSARSGAAGQAGAPSGVAGQASAPPIAEIVIAELACVGRPIVVTAKFLDSTGVPVPFVTITQIATLGTVTPFEQGPGNDFQSEFTAQRWGNGVPGRDGKEEILTTVAYPGGALRVRSPLDVFLCLGGEWQDGPRTIEIDHQGAVVTARIISGTSSECQQSGLDFSGMLSGTTLTGYHELQICNPKECVPRPIPTAIDWADYTATVANDAMSIEFTWTPKVGDNCSLGGTEQRRFTITRTGPVGRFGS